MTSRAKQLEIRFPAAGVVRRPGFRDSADQAGSPYPTPWAVNVRPEDILAKRLRGGSMPTDRPSVGDFPAPSQILYQDRLVDIDSTNPNVVKLSRQGNYSLWDFGTNAGDKSRAYIFQLSEAGEIGGDATALIPHRDSYLLASTADDLWVVNGNLAADGTMRNVSRNAGIVSANAWCKVDDSVVFLAKDGVYMVGCDGSGLKNLSQEKIPEELLNQSSATLGYEHPDQGVYIFTSTEAWFFDLVHGGFWPMDESDKATSHLLLGPFRLNQGDSFGRLTRIHGATSEDSGDVTWSVVAGDTAEDAIENAKYDIENGVTTHVVAEGTWSAGKSHSAYPRTRSPWIVVWLSSESDWAYEGVILEITASGRWR